MANTNNEKALFSKPTSNGAAIVRMIKSIGERNATLKAYIHVAARSAAMHCAEHSDPVHINNLFNVLGEGWRRSSLAKWFIEFAPVSFNSGSEAKDKRFSLNKTKRDEMQAKLDDTFSTIESAVPFWEFDAPEQFQGFALVAAVKAAIKKGEKLQETHKDDPEALAKIDMHGLAMFKRALEAFQPEGQAN